MFQKYNENTSMECSPTDRVCPSQAVDSATAPSLPCSLSAQDCALPRGSDKPLISLRKVYVIAAEYAPLHQERCTAGCKRRSHGGSRARRIAAAGSARNNLHPRSCNIRLGLIRLPRIAPARKCRRPQKPRVMCPDRDNLCRRGRNGKRRLRHRIKRIPFPRRARRLKAATYHTVPSQYSAVSA